MLQLIRAYVEQVDWWQKQSRYGVIRAKSPAQPVNQISLPLEKHVWRSVMIEVIQAFWQFTNFELKKNDVFDVPHFLHWKI